VVVSLDTMRNRVSLSMMFQTKPTCLP
jgi:hypothetical protein